MFATKHWSLLCASRHRPDPSSHDVHFASNRILLMTTSNYATYCPNVWQSCHVNLAFINTHEHRRGLRISPLHSLGPNSILKRWKKYIPNRLTALWKVDNFYFVFFCLRFVSTSQVVRYNCERGSWRHGGVVALDWLRECVHESAKRSIVDAGRRQVHHSWPHRPRLARTRPK